MRKVLLRRPPSLFMSLFLFLITSFAVRAADREVGTGKPYTTIQAAINDANPGDVIRIFGTYANPAGLTINVNKSVTIQGEPGSKIETAGAGNLFLVSVANVKVTDLEIEKTDNNVHQNIIQVQANNFEMTECNVHAKYAMGDGEVTRGVEVGGGFTGLNIHDNTFSSLRQPAYINTSTGVVADNLVKVTRGWVVNADANIIFSGNTWGAGTEANYVDIAFIIPASTNNYTNIVAVSNSNNNAVVENQTYNPRILSIVHVKAGASGGDGTIYNPYPTIAQAIPRAAEGGKVLVSAGTYTENINITKNLILKGNNAGVNAVTGNRLPETLLVPAATAATTIRLETGKNLEVDGFAFNGSSFIQGGTENNLEVNNCEITTSAESGSNCVYIGQPFDQFVFANNDVVMTGGCQATIQPVGIYNGTGADNNVTITGNKFTTTVMDPGSGVRPVAVNLSGNQGTVSNNLFDGIDIGILLGNTTGNLTIEKNTFTGLVRTATEQGNSSFAAGVVLFQSIPAAPITIQNNFFSLSDVGVRTSAPPTTSGDTVNITNNSFTDIAFFYIRNGSSSTFGANCNWYGTVNSDSIAAKMFRSVNYSPFLTNGTDASSEAGFQPVDGSCNGTIADNDGDNVLNGDDSCPQFPNTNSQTDTDGDGIGDVCDTDDDGDGVADANDCAPLDATINPNATEICDGKDNNCDGNIDEGVKTTFYHDGDNDGYGNNTDSIQACAKPTGYVTRNGDCNDANSAINPGAKEICGNTIDENCDGVLGDGCLPQKSIKVNIYGGVNPYNNPEWNNWDVVDSTNSGLLKYSDQTSSTVNATLSQSNGVQDNLSTYGGGMAPAEVLRYTSSSGVTRTLTISGLSASRMYNLEFYASRNNTGNSTTFIVNGTSVTVNTSKNKTNKASFVNLVPTTAGQLVISIRKVNSFNYLNGFTLTELETAPPPVTKLLKVNLFGGTNAFNDSAWNNWDVANSLNSGLLKYSNADTSGVSAALSQSNGVQDNGGSYGGTMAPPQVLRYTSSSSVARTLTFSGLSANKMYNIELYASRNSASGNVTTFTIDNVSKSVATYRNKTNKISFTNLTATAGGVLVITIESANTFNYLNGFILTETGSDDNNNNDAVTTTATAIPNTSEVMVAKEKVQALAVSKLNISAYPNPAPDYFTLQLQSSNKQSLKLRIMDAGGRVIEVKQNVAPNTTFTIGHNYRPGMYYVEVVQGTERKTVKLIKGSKEF